MGETIFKIFILGGIFLYIQQKLHLTAALTHGSRKKILTLYQMNTVIIQLTREAPKKQMTNLGL